MTAATPRPLGWVRRRPLLWALLLSAALHAVLYLEARRVRLPPAASKAQPYLDLTIETSSPKPAAPPASLAAAPQSPSAPASERAKASRRAASADFPAPPAELAAPSVGGPAANATAAPGAAAPPATAAQASVDMAVEVPHRLDLEVHQRAEPASPGGETVQNLPGQVDPSAERPSLAKARIEGWIEDDSARRRVDKGLVDDWFAGLGQSLDRALAASPPPAGSIKSIASDLVRGYQASAENYGRTGNPGTPSGPDDATGAIQQEALGHEWGPSAGALGTMGTFHVQTGAAAPGLWAVIELDYLPSGELQQSRVISSSGDRAFNKHVLRVVALGLPGIPELPDAGLGIHAQGTRSVWQVEGHLTFERDLKSVTLKDDAWYLPLAAVSALAGAGGGFDEVSGYVGFSDFRHPHLKCDVKLLQVY